MVALSFSDSFMEIYPYGFAQTSGELDDALDKMARVFEDMLELAQVEKTMQLLAEEIEKTRRRVNALEYVMIPELEGNIKYISMKLAENENATKVRLLKVKEMVLEQALLYPKQRVELDMKFKNVMSVDVPVFEFHTENEDPSEIYPYGFAQTSGELDTALEALSRVFQDMLELAQVEKTMQLLAEEIEKTRRRVNALEYVMIPQFKENIKYITMKLDENERGNITRLMKVKDMILQEALEERREQSAM